MVRKSKQSRRSHNSNRDDVGPYTGPIRLNNPSTSMRTERMNLMLFDVATSSAPGLLSFSYKTSSVTSASDWAGLAGIFEEFRVVAFEVKYLPYADGAYNPTLKPSSGCMATVHVPGEAAPAGADVVATHDTWSPWYSYREKTVSWRARSIEELQWVVTSTVNDAGAIIGAINELAGSTTYGKFVVTFVVEFRGRR